VNDTVRISPPNSLLLIGDPRTKDLPESLGDGLLAATDSCVAVGTLVEVDGPTTITLTDREGADPAALPSLTVFSGRLTLPSGILAVCDVNGEMLLRRDSPDHAEHVTILVNDPDEPDEIAVVAGT